MNLIYIRSVFVMLCLSLVTISMTLHAVDFEVNHQPSMVVDKDNSKAATALIAHKLAQRHRKQPVKMVDFKDFFIKKGVLDQEGYITEPIVENLITHYWPFLAPVKAFDITLTAGGASTGKIFVIKHHKHNAERAIFIVKISPKNAQQEAINLKKIQESLIARLGYLALIGDRYQSIPHLPIITQVEALFSYTIDSQGTRRTVEVLHAAQGDTVFNVMEKESGKTIASCGYYVGKALGSFHRAFMKTYDTSNPRKWRTVVHGDFHQKNIFYNQKTHRVYFIDNENMANSLDTLQPLETDIIYFIFNYCLGWVFIAKDSFYWVHQMLLFSNFIKGYVEAFPDDVQQPMRLYLLGVIDEHITMLKQFIKGKTHKDPLIDSVKIWKQFGEWTFPFTSKRVLFDAENKQDRLLKKLNQLYSSIEKAVQIEPDTLFLPNKDDQEEWHFEPLDKAPPRLFIRERVKTRQQHIDNYDSDSF